MKLRKKITALAAAILAINAEATPAPQAPAPTLEAAEDAYNAYNFDLAESILDKLTTPARGRKKNSAPTPAPEQTEAIETLRDRIVLARDMMARVEKVVLIDSMTVDRDEFFKSIRLAAPTGRLADEEPVERILGLDSQLKTVAPVYITEDGSEMLFTAYNGDADEPMSIYSLDRLADGSWEAPRKLFDRATIFGDGIIGDVYSPFQMADGVTVYFSADGPTSLGGLDIYMARRDNDGFLQPTNVGMPYNSPANDYMMAIDEATGLGWWATDRGTTDDTVRIYVFAPSDLRVNYPADTDGLPSIALLENVAGLDRGEVAKRLASVAELERRDADTPGLNIALPDGRIVCHVNELRNRDARDIAADLTETNGEIKAMEQRLAKLRRMYGEGDRSVGQHILEIEDQIVRCRAKAAGLVNEIVRAETASNRTR